MSNDFLAEVKKINKDADFLSDSVYGEIKEYISFGALGLNSIVTGDFAKGVPSGRVISIEGESGVGKSFISGKIAAEAQAKGYNVIWFDSENATDKFFLQRLGVDINSLIYLPVITIEEFRNQCYKILTMLEEKQKKRKKAEPEIKLIIILDSLGNLCSAKEIKDLEAGKDAQDMGQRAKIIKSMTRTLTGFLARTDTPMIIVNHGMWSREVNPKIPPKFNPTGGLGVIYLSSIRILLSKKALKEDEDDKYKLTGNILKAKTVKNRIVPEQQTTEIKVDFKTGVNKYFGLLEYAMDFGFFTKDKTRYIVTHLNNGEKYYETELYVPEIWEPILNDLSAKIQSVNKFSSVSDGVLDEQENDQEEVKVVKTKRAKFSESDITPEQSGEGEDEILTEEETQE